MSEAKQKQSTQNTAQNSTQKSSQKTAIQPTRAENYPEWYQQVVKAADLAEFSTVRGCMVMKPLGYGILGKKFSGTWTPDSSSLDMKIFTVLYFIPLSYLEKRGGARDRFCKRMVRWSRIIDWKKNAEGKLQPAGLLEEPLIVRPTSETVIGEMFSRWIQSYRDLPVLVNQWANVVRWEMRTRLFLRTTEFLWQEGHTAHASKEEALEETHTMLNVYAETCRDVLAMPVIKGEKSKRERFPGAENTFCIEAMMQDQKAPASGHFALLGTKFVQKAFNIFNICRKQVKLDYVHTTSWGCFELV